MQAYMMFEEMHKRGIQVNNLTLASLIYGLLVRGRVREAYRVVEGIEKPDINVYHGLIKVLRLRRASEATQVFSEMIKKGCKPTMHYYSNEEGVVMFEEVAKKLREVGLVDLAEIFERFGMRMAMRDRRRNISVEP